MDIYYCDFCKSKVKSEGVPGSCIYIFGKIDEDGCYQYRGHHPYEYNCCGEMTSNPYHNWKLIKKHE